MGGADAFGVKKATKILHSIANLAVMQMDLEKFTTEAKHPLTGEKETIPGGEFGRILRHEILFIDKSGEALSVDHLDFDGDPRNPQPDDIDKFSLSINGRDTDLYLVRAYGRPDKGIPEWGVKGLVFLMDIMEGNRVVKVIRKDLSIRRVSGEWTAYYKIEELAPNGTPLKPPLEFKFIQGNPNPIPLK